MSLRLWLIILGVLVFALIGFDAWRKSNPNLNRKNNVRKSKKFSNSKDSYKNLSDDYDYIDEDLDYNSNYDFEELQKRKELERELPYGGSRKLGEAKRNSDYLHDYSDNQVFADDPIPLLKEPLTQEESNLGAGLNSGLDTSNIADNLYRTEQNFTSQNLNSQQAPSAFSQFDEQDADDFVNSPQAPQASTDFIEPKLDFNDNSDFQDLNSLQDEHFLQAQDAYDQQDFHEDLHFTQQFNLEESQDLEDYQEVCEDLFEMPITKGLVELEKDQWKKNEESIFIRVMAQSGEEYNLADFWDFCCEADLRLSERGFVHRFLESDGRNYIQFSILNAVEPGNFLMLNKPNAYTKGLIFVQTLPGGYAPNKIIDDMVNIARVFVDRFGGNVLDEGNSVLTDQTVHYYKDKIRKFKLKSKLPYEKDSEKRK